MSASMTSRPSIIVEGPIVSTTISAASRVNDQLILSLGAVSGEVTWLTALEAQSILRTEGVALCGVVSGLGSLGGGRGKRGATYDGLGAGAVGRITPCGIQTRCFCAEPEDEPASRGRFGKPPNFS